jgi:hypothetical protein
MKLWKSKFKPARDQIEGVEVVADLDALMNEPVPFRLAGKVYKIKPLSSGEAFVLWNNLAKVEALRAKDSITFTELLDFYAGLFKSACPEVTREMVEKMSQQQCAALLQLILDTVTGRIFADDKKKAMKADQSTSQSTQP